MAGVRKRGAPKKRVTVTTTARLPEDLHKALSAAADEWGLTLNYVINRAVRDFLTDHGWLEDTRKEKTG